MRLSLSLPLSILSALSATTSALPSTLQDRDTASILKYRSWQLRLFSESQPTCNPNASNIDISIWSRSGRYGTTCDLFDPSSTYPEGSVPKSLGFKNIDSDGKVFCMFNSSSCTAESLLGSITSGWEVCYPYNGWVAFSVVDAGESCV